MPPSLDYDGASESLEHDPSVHELPDDTNEVWENSTLGPKKRWSPALRSFATFIATQPYPVAIFWGEELSLVHNEAWKQAANGAARQGDSYKDALGEEALATIRTAMIGKPRRSLNAEQFLKNESQDGTNYTALVGPIMEEHQAARGVIIQLFETTQKSEEKKSDQNTMMEQVQASLNDKMDGDRFDTASLESTPLDENPFFQRFASMLPTGMAILNHKAEAVFVNEQFFELTTASGQDFMSWPKSIHADDYDRVMDAYQTTFNGSGEPLRLEFRTQAPKDPWRLLMVTALSDSRMRDESIEKYGGFICAVIDITPNKAQEEAQKKAAQEANERKEQQERFIDMISHEIRNPLSAVLHCAEEIADEIDSSQESGSGYSRVSTSALNESVETIKLCVAHQKNIVDDILSYSKLDASMLSLAPRNAQPKRQLGDALKMFQPEVRKLHIELEYKVDHSFEDIDVDWVRADLVRTSQVLVNLVTNAIKFTAKKEGEKKITTMIGVSEERPTSYPPSVVFFDTDDMGYRMDGTNTSEWGNGQAIYIMVAVKDTGIGISASDQKKLFQRFRQATPKTEETYGGSGLGLSISRKLCQLHGGEIGVSSIEGEGSTFGFFFKARRLEEGGEQRPSSDQISTQDLRDRLKQVSKGDAPIIDIAEADVQDSLKEPKVEHISELGPSTLREDAQWEHTAEVVSGVEETPGDEYSQGERINSKPSSGSGKGLSKLEKMQRKTDSDLAKRKQDSSDTETGSARSQSHVLLVEDNIINQRILRRKLEAKKFKVTLANNGREAVHAVQAQCKDQEPGKTSADFDVILMDQEMPVLDGNAATKEIRRLEEAGEVSHVPILGVTANVRDEQKEEMMSSGMDDVISKPYSMDALIDKIQGLMHGGSG